MKTEKFIWFAAAAAIAPTLIVGILILVERKLDERKLTAAQTISKPISIP